MKKILVFLLLFISCFTIYLVNNTKEVVAATYTQDDNGNWYWGYNSQLDESYYSDLTGITDKTDFEETLHEIISTGYNRITYGNRKNCLYEADQDPNNSNNVLCLYTGISFSKSAGGSSGTNVWNTEHTWAKSHGFPNEGDTPYSDLHHLRVTQAKINETRSSCGFKELTTSADSYGNKKSGEWFEPRDCVKGDVARIMMYMDVRYSGDSLSNNFKLTLVNGVTTGNSSKDGKFGDLQTLLKWHAQDPVDDLERRRNDVVEKYQNNRNPFIDHPEYANIIYGADYSTEGGSGNTPETPTTYKVTYNANGGSFSYSDSTKYTSGSLVTQPTPKPAKDGYTFIGWYKEASCTTKWNFATDKITSNLTLYAGYEEVKQNFVDVFKKLSVKSQLTFNVNVASGGGEVQTPTEGSIVSKFTNDISTAGDYDLSDYIEFDEDLFDIQYKKNMSAFGYISTSKSKIKLYPGTDGSGNGTSIEIVAKPGVKITNVTAVEDKSDSKHKVAPTITFTDGKAVIQNTTNQKEGNQCVLSSFTINYTVGGSSLSYSLEDESLCLNYVLQLSESAYSLYKQSNKTIDLKINDQAATYVVSKVGNEYRLVYSIKITDYTTLYKPVFSYDGENVTISGYSAKTLAQHYLNNYLSDSLVKQYKSCLEQIVG